MTRIIQIIALLSILFVPAIAVAQGQSQARGPRVLPPPVTLPAALGGRTITSAERDHPHSPSNSDKNHPLTTGHRLGTPHPAGPTPPQPQPRRSDDPTGILRLLGLGNQPAERPVEEPADQGGTLCVIGAIGGSSDNYPVYQGMVGEGWMGCSSTAGWVYYTYQELNLFRCHQSFAGWCLPFADEYVWNLAVCEARFTEQIKWCGPAYNHSIGPSEYYVRNDTWFQAPGGYASDYVDSALFWLN